MMFPSPPEGGGYLVLNKHQLSNLDLLCAIKTMYPQTKIIAQQPIPIYQRLNFGPDLL